MNYVRHDERTRINVGGVIITAPETVQLQRLSVAGPGEGELVVRVSLCGICTPEQRVYRGTRATYPYWGGHELWGVVESAHGTQDSALKIGDRVAVALMDRCGHCPACRAGLDNHCAYLHVFHRPGLPTGPGGFTERMVIPAYKAFRLPTSVPDRTAALVEPVACVLRSVSFASPQPGEFAAVIGGGTMGLIHTIALALKGCRVHLFDDDENTHEAALAGGACYAGPLELLSDPRKMDAWTDGWGFDVLFCTRFGSRAIELSIRAAARGARVVLYQSIPGEDALTLSANTLHYREIRIIGSVAQSARDLRDAVGMIAGHGERFLVLRTEVFPAAEAGEAFRRAIAPDVNRVMIQFEG